MKSIVGSGIDNKIIPKFKKKLKIYVYKSLKRVSRISLYHILKGKYNWRLRDLDDLFSLFYKKYLKMCTCI